MSDTNAFDEQSVDSVESELSDSAPMQSSAALTFTDATVTSPVVEAEVSEAEAAEARGIVDGEEGGKKGKAKAEKKAPAKRKSRSKTAEPERKKLFWGVFNQSAKRIALFIKTAAEQDLSGSQ